MPIFQVTTKNTDGSEQRVTTLEADDKDEAGFLAQLQEHNLKQDGHEAYSVASVKEL